MADEIKICPTCGSEILEGAKFCNNCGTDLTDIIDAEGQEDLDSAESLDNEDLEENEEEEDNLVSKVDLRDFATGFNDSFVLSLSKKDEGEIKRQMSENLKNMLAHVANSEKEEVALAADDLDDVALEDL